MVDFTDECDSFGTRVTSRRYTDGSVVIETPPRPIKAPGNLPPLEILVRLFYKKRWHAEVAEFTG